MSILDRSSVVTFPWGATPPRLQDVVAVAQHAEQLGFYSVNLPLVNVIRPRAGGPFAKLGNAYTLDALALLPAMVMATSTIRVAVDAIPVFLLPPFAWAKYFASLDVISGGRVIVGMCLGFGEEHFGAVGLRQKDRGRIADEQLQVIRRLWTEDHVSHEGAFYRLFDVSLDPKPVQRPHPPIWWGGRQPSIPRAARHCQFLNTLWPTRDEVRHDYVPALRRETARWGTCTGLASWFYCRVTPEREMPRAEVDAWFGDLMEMEVKVVPSDVTLAGSPEQFAAAMRAYEGAGIQHFVLDFQRHGLEDSRTTREQMDLFAKKVVPLLASQGVPPGRGLTPSRE